MIVLLTTMFTLNNLLDFSLWAFVGDRLRVLFASEGQARRMNRFFGVMLALIAAWMVSG